MKNRIFFSIIMLGMALAVSGCAKKADPDRPVEKIKRDVEKMPVSDLEEYAHLHVAAFKDRRAELDKIIEEIKGLPGKGLSPEKLNSERSRLKEDLLKVQNDATALLERYQIYLKKFLEKGGDARKVQISF